MCLFCLLKTTSLNEFMISLPGSAFDILKYFPVFSARCFGLQDSDISTESLAENLSKFLTAEILRSLS